MPDENYIQIFCTYVARLLEAEKFSLEDSDFMIQEFIKVAENVRSREQLVTFLEKYPDYPEFGELISRLKDPSYQFIF